MQNQVGPPCSEGDGAGGGAEDESAALLDVDPAESGGGRVQEDGLRDGDDLLIYRNLKEHN